MRPGFGQLERLAKERAFLNMRWQKVMALGVNVRAVVAAATVWSLLTQNAATVYADSRLVDPRIPEVVSSGGRVLALNGAGVGTKFLIHVYLIGLYLEKKTTDARTAIATDEAKRISLIMLRNVSRQQFVDAVEKGMVRNSGLPMPTLRSRLDLLEQALPALKKGDRLDFTYLPGAGTVVRGEGRELKIPGKDFADALFSVWLGPHADSSSLRHDLLGGN
jgi:hypothetical protein